MPTVFTYNQHPAYLYLLSHVDAEFVVVGEWGVDTRSHPDNVRFIDSCEADEYAGYADVWLSHLITPDLARFAQMGRRIGWPDKLVQIMHGRSDRVGHLRSPLARAGYRAAKQAVIPVLWAVGRTLDIEYVYISDYVADSWRIGGHTIYPAVLPELYEGGQTDGEDYALVVGNELHRGHFEFDILQQVIGRRDVRVCGANPQLVTEPGRVSWGELKRQYRNANCYVNLLQPPENSFNLATLEAIGSGTPIVTLQHPESVFENGVTALVCETAEEVVEAMDRLRDDEALAKRLRTNAHQLAAETFDMERFQRSWRAVLSA
ncbi:glycosyltransferase [Haloprofundus salilacus]|uniref:glycosyltransferase n=1 Tax=Haloprofundus salilacus TaxID=2876190 RepID=UPI001CCEC219|nr:glycosyltransferase [Haloprofundus salilacus]